jgi:signal transduction histidine kinase
MSSPANRRILLIDDTPAIHDDFRASLLDPEAEGLAAAELALFGETCAAAPQFELESAYQGQQAVEKLRASVAADRPYALAFVDMRMPPGWDGVETIERMWREDPRLQVVVCTAYTDYSWKEVLTRLDAGDRLLVLKKPFDSIEVLQLATTLTAKWTTARRAALTMADLEHTVVERTRELQSANDTLQAEIADRKFLENQLVQSQKLESIGQLAAGIGHEINTPVQFVTDSVQFVADGFADMAALIATYRAAIAGAGDAAAAVAATIRNAEAAIDLEYLSKNIPAALDRSLAGLARIASIVVSLKNFAHTDAKEPIDVELNSNILSTLTIACSEWKYVADVRTELGELPLVRCHPGEINQVILNLLMNAAHAIDEAVAGTDRRGVITVQSRRDGDHVLVSIADTGPGIPVAIRHRIFDPFFTTKDVGRGTGQGLAISRSIVVVKHGGELTFETELGRGTTFFVRLPIDGAAPRACASV